MSTYFITGVSRGLGWEFLSQLSKDPANTVIGLVRDKAATDAKVTKELSRDNVHIIAGDITDYDSLKSAAEQTANITGGSLDYLISNAALLPSENMRDGFGTLGAKDPKALEADTIEQFKTNAVSNIHLFNLFMPLILKGKQKKIVAISSGLADLDMIKDYDLDFSAPYTLSKVALNGIVAKFSAEYREQGVLAMAICPGMVDTRGNKPVTPEEQQWVMGVVGKFLKFAPNFTGPNTPESAVSRVISVFEKASLESGSAGVFVSQFGNKTWL